MIEDKCPCENCITFIMCKDRLYNKHGKQVVKMRECPYLDAYVGDITRHEYKFVSHVDETRRVFGLNPVNTNTIKRYEDDRSFPPIEVSV
jgi:hypothetical protein